MRRALVLALVLCVSSAAGCGYEGTVTPTASAAAGPLPQQKKLAKGDPKAGKAVYADNGCGGCHTFRAAGSAGKTGPDLDKLAEYARKADQGPLDRFVETSIVNPSAYVEEGYENVMPGTYGDLTTKQLSDLIAFLTQNQK